MSAAELQSIQQAAIRDVVRMQEEIGLKVVTDGEFNRHSWHRDFMLKFANVKLVPSKMKVRFHTAEGDRDNSAPALNVIGKLARPADGGIFVDDFKFLVSIAHATPKLTIPSPTRHALPRRTRGDRRARPIRTWRRSTTISPGSIARRSPTFARAGCRYLQIDEVNLAYLCDPELRRQVANIGEDPATLPKTYARLINDTIRDRPADMTVCMHLCRGNFAGAWVAEGGYEPIADLLFNEIEVDGYFLEYDSARAGALRAAAIPPQGQGRGARPGHDQEPADGDEGRAQAPHRRGRAVRRRSISSRCRRNAAFRAASAATRWMSRARSRSCALWSKPRARSGARLNFANRTGIAPPLPGRRYPETPLWNVPFGTRRPHVGPISAASLI